MNLPTEHAAKPNCNIELKARLLSFEAAEKIAKAIAEVRLPDQHQIDTYFHCSEGRLKLREIIGQRAELIAYCRANENGPKASKYFVLPVSSPDRFKEALTTTLGIRSCVEKHRQIYLHQNVRIHLDRVSKLGDFLEFEAVLSDEHLEPDSRRLVEDLRDRFELSEGQLLRASYGEMIEGV
ncbi:MAG: class IV adenylate cyclase [Planctomycetaceae bacterium]|nr:class IV adenylate cyclase [Planctomycetales bacterium]MCB9925252.1 class IV adenylate cyclase [Planctomycetaceae bacterium]